MKVLLIAAVFRVVATVLRSPQMIEMSGTWELNTRKTLGPSPVQETLVFDITVSEEAPKGPLSRQAKFPSEYCTDRKARPRPRPA